MSISGAAGFSVVRCRKAECGVGFGFAELADGFGAANLVNSLATFVWLGCFDSVGFVAVVFLLMSRAAICRVTEAIEVML